jgi:2-hydroxycyclohexanecarboxyl-CoA dehydrogenase
VADTTKIKVPQLPESTVVIAGGTSGVGLAAAHRFLAAGVPRLALLGRSAQRGKDALHALGTDHPEASVQFVATDATDPAQVTASVDQITSAMGSIDVLVNSTTGSSVPALLKDTPIENVAAMFTEQALPPMYLTRAVLPSMRAQRGGVIINIASDAAKTATPGESVLGGAMAAIVMFSRTAAIEGKRDGIRVNALTPSLILGTMAGERSMAGGFSAKLFSKAIEAAHLGVTHPDDLAGLIVFLSGPDAALLTGQAISVNGGISAA